MALHMDATNGLMNDAARITSDKPTEKEQRAELQAYARALPKPSSAINGARYWAIDVSGDNRRFALDDPNVTKHARGSEMYLALAKLGAATRQYPTKP